jgi:hypothetical protein
MNRIETVISSTKTIDMKVELLVTQKHPKGDIKKGSIYLFDKGRNTYVLKNENDIIVASANEAAVDAMPHMFKKLKE